LDPRPAPWRVFELPDAEGAEPEDGGPRDGPAPAGRSSATLTLSVAWTAAAVVLAVGIVAVVGFLIVSAPSSTVTIPEIGASAPVGSGDAGGPVGPAGPVVEVAGAVVHPGVYRLAPGARVADAITAAGGYSPRVDAGRADRETDLARIVSDGEEIRIPSRDDPSSGPGGSPGSAGGGATGNGTATGSGPVDLNTATEAQLDALPGIGPVTAARIVASRATQRFRSVDDLQTRKLVGKATLEKLRKLIVVR
jgi:competence protein ComEA